MSDPTVPIAEVSTPEIKAVLMDALEAMQEALVEHARAAVATLAAASTAAGMEGTRLLGKIGEVGTLLANGEIDQGTATLSVSNYLEAVKMTGYGLANKAQVEAFKRGVRLLETFTHVALGVLTMALQVAVPGAAGFLGELVGRIGRGGRA